MAFYRVTLRQAFKGRELQNVFCLEDDNTPSLSQLEIALIVQQHWVEAVRLFQSNTLRHFQITVRRILWPDPLATTVLDINTLGAIASSFVAMGWIAVPLNFYSELLGSKHRGRYFHGGILTSHISDASENLNASGTGLATTMISTLTNKFAGDAPTTGLHLCVAHKDDTTPTRVSTIGVITFLTFLRSRKLFHGI